MSENMESSGGASAVCPWDEPSLTENAAVSVSVCPWDDEEPPSTSKQAIARYIHFLYYTIITILNGIF